jgi:hypothetical protein
MGDESHRVDSDVRVSDYKPGMQWRSHICATKAQYDIIQTLKRRLPPVSVSGGLFNLKQFKSPAYSVYTAAAFVAFLGLYTGQSVHMHSWARLTNTHRQC